MKSVRTKAEADARETFKHHVLKVEGEGRWYFGPKNGSNNMDFRVIDAPGALIMFGDAGELMFQPHGRSALGWLRSVLERESGWSVEYIAEKVPATMQGTATAFDPELCKKWLREKLEDLKGDDYEEDDGTVGPIERLRRAARHPNAARMGQVEEMLDDVEWRSTDHFYEALRDSDLELTGEDYPCCEALTSRFFTLLVGLKAFVVALNAHEAAPPTPCRSTANAAGIPFKCKHYGLVHEGECEMVALDVRDA